jgi:hypothetical protein
MNQDFVPLAIANDAIIKKANEDTVGCMATANVVVAATGAIILPALAPAEDAVDTIGCVLPVEDLAFMLPNPSTPRSDTRWNPMPSAFMPNSAI